MLCWLLALLDEIKNISLFVFRNGALGNILEGGFKLIAKLTVVCKFTKALNVDHIKAVLLEECP